MWICYIYYVWYILLKSLPAGRKTYCKAGCEQGGEIERMTHLLKSWLFIQLIMDHDLCMFLFTMIYHGWSLYPSPCLSWMIVMICACLFTHLSVYMVYGDLTGIIVMIWAGLFTHPSSLWWSFTMADSDNLGWSV